MDDENISTFCAITETDPQRAQQYLQLADGNVEQAVELFFNNPDLGALSPAPAPAQSTSDNPITIDDDDDDMADDDVQETGSRPAGGASYEDDEAMARRLQQEMFGGGGGGGGGGGHGAVEEDGVRAPMARTTETLVGPGSDWRDDPTQMSAAINEQIMNRHRARHAPAGIFNQQQQSIWSNNDAGASSSTPLDPEAHQRALSRATGGASDTTSKSNLLAELFRPPFDLISPLPTWSAARDEGKDSKKWILVNIQDPSIFDCQVLNRDIWKNASVRDTIKEHFIFLQYNKDDHRGQEYINYYFSMHRDNEAAYPHIAIVDPRTGEQVKTWSGSPAPKANEFLMDLHEFLDRYSLDMGMKNPVQAKRKEKRKDVGQMSEEEMLEMAMLNSLENGKGVAGEADADPDALTKEIGGAVEADGADGRKGKVPASSSSTSNGHPPTPFSLIPSDAPHTEPPTSPDTTRIQFRHRGGRVVRRFALSDPVQRLYEWLKAEPLEEAYTGKDFELVCMGRNLIGDLETTVEGAGLKNGTVMVEVAEGEDEAE